MSQEIVIWESSKDIVASKEYSGMLEHINKHLPDIKRDSQNFFKSASQLKNVTLDVTDLTPMSSIKHVLAVLNQTRQALEEAQITLERKKIDLKEKQEKYDSLEDGYEKQKLYIDIVELAVHSSNLEDSIKGAIRKMSFFTTQYNALMEKLGKDNITEKDFELEEDRYHVMTAMKQALNAARTRGGMIDEGNHIYLFEMGINGAVAQHEILAYLNKEQEMLANGLEPSHEMTMAWLEACADKFGSYARKFAESRGFIPLDAKSLAQMPEEE